MKDKCSPVSKVTKQEQDVIFPSIRDRWDWTESSVWTDKNVNSSRKGSQRWQMV